jgi:hypothetical protein
MAKTARVPEPSLHSATARGGATGGSTNARAMAPSTSAGDNTRSAVASEIMAG